MRKLKRSVAKFRMRKQGIRRMCRHAKGDKSYFAKHWREFL